MIDQRVRPHLQGLLEPVGRGLARLGVTPTYVTLTGLAVAVAGAVVIGTGGLLTGGLIAAAGAAIDGFDGSVARASGRVSDHGAFLDATVDRLGEIAVLTGLAVSQRGDARILLLALLALGGAMMIPYIRAKAESLGVDGRGGLMGRAERVILLTAGLVTGWVEPMLWAMVVSTWFTAGQRFWSTYRSAET